MLFTSSRLSTQEVLDKASLGPIVFRVLYYIPSPLQVSSSSSACASSIFKKSFGYTELPRVILCIHHLCFFFFFSLFLHNGPAFQLSRVQSFTKMGIE